LKAPVCYGSPELLFFLEQTVRFGPAALPCVAVVTAFSLLGIRSAEASADTIAPSQYQVGGGAEVRSTDLAGLRLTLAGVDSGAGFATVRWERSIRQAQTDQPASSSSGGRAAEMFELQMSRPGGAFAPLYAGPQQGSFVSGLPSGRYRFRVRTQPDGAWSPVVEFDVAHHPWWLANTLFAAGGLAFLATLGVLWRAGAAAS